MSDTAPPELPPIREVMERYGLSPQKSLGQNFLLDLNLTRRIARASGSLVGRQVIEVGPGPGGLTRALLELGAERVIAIEMDHRCVLALEELSAAYPGRLQIVEGDALKTDMRALVGGRARIIANLPYNVGTPLLVRWLQTEPWPPWFETMTLMFQKEVAQRIVAPPRSRAYGRLAVLAQWRTHARILFDVDRRAFTPPPSVTSSVVELIPRPKPLAPADPKILEKVVAAAFGQRRKMLRAALKPIARDPVTLLEAAHIDPTMRAEQLSVEQFCQLAETLRQQAF